MENIPDFKRHLGRPYDQVATELTKEFPEFEIREIRSDWLTTSDFRVDRINILFTPESDAVTGIDIG